MSQSLTDQRQRAELIAELYDLHAAELFAYCADQLGDLGSASDVLVAVLSSVPATAPPRAALYAFARREIHRRDIVYSPPAVDPLIDPATALVERALRELRPHQREVLMLCAVCGLSKAELAWVLDVAPDTAEELAVGAGHRFRQSLGAALASTGVRVPKPVADVYGALGVAPLRDVLGRLPWPQPPGALRIHFAGSRPAPAAPLFVKPRWPSPPVWPQPLSDADPASSTVIFPAELLTPPSPVRRAEHDATTAPMPKLRDGVPPPRDVLDPGPPLRDPLGSARTRGAPPSGFSAGDLWVAGPSTGDRASTGPSDGDQWVAGSGGGSRTASGPPPHERPFFMAAPGPLGAEPFATGDVILPKDAPDPYMTGDVLLHSAPSRPLPPPHRPAAERHRPAPAAERWQASRTEEPVRGTAAPLFQPRAQAGPETRTDVVTAPEPAPQKAERKTERKAEPRPDEPLDLGGGPAAPSASSLLAPRPVRARPAPKRRPDNARPQKVRRRKERHYDWVWEVVGFLLCVAIAMIVFFSMPIFADH